MNGTFTMLSRQARPAAIYVTKFSKCSFSVGASDSKTAVDYEGIDSFTRMEMEKRHKGITMNQNSISQYILPGEKIVKTNQKTGVKKMLAIERSMGYFWYLKDLTETDGKPILSNQELIPTEIAQVFPPLNEQNNGSLKTLDGKEESLPHYFMSGNRSKDPSAFCTLVGVAFTDFGNKMLPSWMDPFEQTFQKDTNRIKTAWLSINEGATFYLLKHFITKASLNKVPMERRNRTLLFFGSCPEMRDVLRMHNTKTGYVFLLDGLGRVRFAGSGKANSEELENLFRMTKELAPGLKSNR